MEKIPQKYQKEFLQEQTFLTKNRLRFFSLFFMSVYVGGNIVYNLSTSQAVPSHLIEAWTVAFTSCMLLMLLSIKAPNMAAIKFSAFFILAVLLFMMASNQIYLSMNIYAVMVTYLFMFFSISLIVPWSPGEIIVVGLLAVSAFTLYFLNAVAIDEEILKYFQGTIVLFLTYLICFFTRRYETEREIENFVLLRESRDNNLKMQEELDLAVSVHAKLVPKSITKDTADIAVTYLPICSLGGDYANFRMIDDKNLIFVICDVTGHGVSAALLVNAVHTEVENLFKEKIQPGFLLKDLGRRIFSPNLEKTSMLLSAFCGLLDYDRMKFFYSNHGHPPQYIYRTEDSGLESLEPQTGMIGMAVDKNEIYQSEVPFKKGDQIILFTDGVIEAKNPDRQNFGYERLKVFIRENHAMYVNVFNEKLLHKLVSFTGNTFSDDIFILNIRTK